MLTKTYENMIETLLIGLFNSIQPILNIFPLVLVLDTFRSIGKTDVDRCRVRCFSPIQKILNTTFRCSFHPFSLSHTSRKTITMLAMTMMEQWRRGLWLLVLLLSGASFVLPTLADSEATRDNADWTNTTMESDPPRCEMVLRERTVVQNRNSTNTIQNHDDDLDVVVDVVQASLPLVCDDSSVIDVRIIDSSTTSSKVHHDNNNKSKTMLWRFHKDAYVIPFQQSLHKNPRHSNHWRGETTTTTRQATLQYIRSSSSIVGSLVDITQGVVNQFFFHDDDEQRRILHQRVTRTPSHKFPSSSSSSISKQHATQSIEPTTAASSHPQQEEGSLRRTTRRSLTDMRGGAPSSSQEQQLFLTQQLDSDNVHENDEDTIMSTLDILVLWTVAAECRTAGLDKNNCTIATTHHDDHSTTNHAALMRDRIHWPFSKPTRPGAFLESMHNCSWYGPPWNRITENHSIEQHRYHNNNSHHHHYHHNHHQ